MQTLLTILSAYDRAIVKTALKTYALKAKGERADEGWKFSPDGVVPPQHEWFLINGRKYVRQIPDYEALMEQMKVNHKKVPPPKPTQESPIEGGPNIPTPTEMVCPICGEKAFPQPVCPNCEKGKSGMKTMWICGSDSDHFFYTEF